MNTEDGTLKLIEQIYDAAIVPDGWGACVETIADEIAGSSAVFIVLDRRTGASEISAPARLDAADLELYAQHYVERDMWLPHALRLPVGKVFTGPSVVGAQEFLASEHYNDFLRRQDIFHVCFAVLFNDRDRMGFLSVFRSRRRDDFELSTQRLVGRLVPHVRRAAQIDFRLRCLVGLRYGLAEALERTGQGVLLVDGEGCVLFANRAAETLLREQDGLHDRGGRLAGATAADTHGLRYLIAGAARAALGDGMEAGGALALARPSGKRPLHALVAPVRRNGFGLEGSEVAAIVFVTDPESDPVLPEQALATLYGLTPAEARLAAALVGGLSLKDYAEQAAITMNTARWTLKQVFQKTETNSQAALVRLLLKGHLSCRAEPAS